MRTLLPQSNSPSTTLQNYVCNITSHKKHRFFIFRRTETKISKFHHISNPKFTSPKRIFLEPPPLRPKHKPPLNLKSYMFFSHLNFLTSSAQPPQLAPPNDDLPLNCSTAQDPPWLWTPMAPSRRSLNEDPWPPMGRLFWDLSMETT